MKHVILTALLLSTPAHAMTNGSFNEGGKEWHFTATQSLMMRNTLRVTGTLYVVCNDADKEVFAAVHYDRVLDANVADVNIGAGDPSEWSGGVTANAEESVFRFSDGEINQRFLEANNVTVRLNVPDIGMIIHDFDVSDYPDGLDKIVHACGIN